MTVVVLGGTWWWCVDTQEERVEPLLSISLVGPGVSLPSGVVLARRGTPLYGPLSIEVPGVLLARPFSGGGGLERLSAVRGKHTPFFRPAMSLKTQYFTKHMGLRSRSILKSEKMSLKSHMTRDFSKKGPEPCPRNGSRHISRHYLKSVKLGATPLNSAKPCNDWKRKGLLKLDLGQDLVKW